MRVVRRLTSKCQVGYRARRARDQERRAARPPTRRDRIALRRDPWKHAGSVRAQRAAAGRHGGGRNRRSHRAPQRHAVARKAGRVLCRQEVAGSIPAGSIFESPGTTAFLLFTVAGTSIDRGVVEAEWKRLPAHPLRTALHTVLCADACPPGPQPREVGVPVAVPVLPGDRGARVDEDAVVPARVAADRARGHARAPVEQVLRRSPGVVVDQESEFGLRPLRAQRRADGRRAEGRRADGRRRCHRGDWPERRGT